MIIKKSTLVKVVTPILLLFVLEHFIDKHNLARRIALDKERRVCIESVYYIVNRYTNDTQEQMTRFSKKLCEHFRDVFK